jgi:hypothetical protein
MTNFLSRLELEQIELDDEEMSSIKTFKHFIGNIRAWAENEYILEALSTIVYVARGVGNDPERIINIIENINRKLVTEIARPNLNTFVQTKFGYV